MENRENAKEAMRIFRSGEATSLKEAWVKLKKKKAINKNEKDSKNSK